MSKFLILVTERRSANGICAKAVMDELIKHGHQVVCVSNKEYDDNDRIIHEDGITYHLVKPRLIYRLMNWHVKCSNQAIKKLAGLLIQGINKTKLFLTIPTWPLISPLYSWRYFKKANSIYMEEAYDIILPVYTQIDTLIAAHLMKRKQSSLLFVPYFLDSLSGGYGPKQFSRSWTIRRGMAWERHLLSNADKVIFMESSRTHHETYSLHQSFYRKVKYLDLPLITPLDSSGWFEVFKKSHVNLLYLGSIPRHIRDPKYFIDLFLKLKDPRYRLYFIGPIDHEYINQKRMMDSRIIVLPPVSHKISKQAMSSASVLINLGNKLESMTPSKIFEYISAGKPIISTFSNKNEPSVGYLKRYGRSLMLNDNAAINDTLREEVELFINSQSITSVSFDEIKNEFYFNTPYAFYAEISPLLSSYEEE